MRLPRLSRRLTRLTCDRYENISKLIETVERTFESQGYGLYPWSRAHDADIHASYFWISNNHIMSQQKGVFRVNCIDGLDRTNVVESAFARHVLNRQLGAVALLNPDERRTEMDIVFNDGMRSFLHPKSFIHHGFSLLISVGEQWRCYQSCLVRQFRIHRHTYAKASRMQCRDIGPQG